MPYPLHALLCRFHPAVLTAALGSLAAMGCTSATENGDGRNDVGVAAGKADGQSFSTCELQRVVSYLNDLTTDGDALRALGLSARAAKNLESARNGGDGLPGTDDDRVFVSIEDVDAVPYVGSATLRALAASVTDGCVGTGTISLETIFSPRPADDSHLTRAAELIDEATRTVDVAIYNFRDVGIRNALSRAVSRGVLVRIVFDEATADKSDPTGTMSAQLETAGMDVRYVNKVMHHKFMLIDGVHAEGDDPAAVVLMTSSGNWSDAAATRFDENSLVIKNSPELAIAYQREWNLLWNNSRDLSWNMALTYTPSEADVPAVAADDPSVDVAFTSSNYVVRDDPRYGPTFSVESGKNTVADRLVALIDSATKSIHVASGHLRSRPVADALVRKHLSDPTIDIRVVTDGQEYIGEKTHADQLMALDACIAAAADSVAKQQDCTDNGFYFSYQLYAEGIGLRFKYYAYRWDYTYADQMHHKYFVVDGTKVATGSYNLSDNAEHETFDNMLFIDGDVFPTVAAAYEAEFDRLWTMGEKEGLYDAYINEVKNGKDASFPIVFDGMALEWPQVATLKSAVSTACPAVNSAEYRMNAAKYRYCER